MKKIFAALLMITLCSCSSPEPSKSTAPAEQPTTTAVITEAVTEAVTEPETTATEIPPAPTTEPPTEPEINELLFNEQGIEIYYQGVDQNIVNLYIVNSNEELPVHAWMQNISVNDNYLENVGCEGYSNINTSNKWPCVMPLEELQNRNITRINDLKFDFYIYLGNNTVAELKDLSITR